MILFVGENEDLKKLISELKEENRDTNDRLVEIKQELEKERRNNMRLAHKFEQDFEFHKQQIVNDCGRHIEELQEEHREHIRNIERKLNTDQRKVFIIEDLIRVVIFKCNNQKPLLKTIESKIFLQLLKQRSFMPKSRT